MYIYMYMYIMYCILCTHMTLLLIERKIYLNMM